MSVFKVTYCNAPFIGISMFYIKYLTIIISTSANAAGAIRKLLYGLCICMEDNPHTKAHGLSYGTDAH